MGNFQLNGKVYESVGSSSSNLCIETKGDIKIKFGNKFIDLIKNGKVNTESKSILQSIDNADNISSNGIYITSDEQVWFYLDGTKINITGQSYISYLTDQTLSADEKTKALTNIGFYYNTLEDAQGNITAGVIYVQDQNKLYIANNGVLSEYTTTLTQETSTDFEIDNLKIYNSDKTSMFEASYGYLFTIGNDTYLTIGDKIISLNKDLVMSVNNYIQTEGATSSYGYRLYMKGSQSVLEVDSLVWRNIASELQLDITTDNDRFISCKRSNVVLSVDDDELTLKYKNNFVINDQIYLFGSLIPDVTISDRTISLEYSVDYDIKLKLEHSNSTETITLTAGQTSYESDLEIIGYTVISGEIAPYGGYNIKTLLSFKITSSSDQQITIDADSKYLNHFKDSDIYSSSEPYIMINEGELTLVADEVIIEEETEETDEVSEIVVEENQTVNKINNVKIGDISELEEQNYQENSLGIFTNNLIGLNNKLYKTEFNGNYPIYGEKLLIPEESLDSEDYNSIVPTIQWIKKLIELSMPVGTIVMFNGTDIPDGWAICDGTNGTPDLIGKFIKASTTIGDNETDLNENNELVLTKENLPDHDHVHKHKINGITSSEGGIIYRDSFETTTYNVSAGEDISLTTSNSNGQMGTITDHTHDIDLTSGENIDNTTVFENKPIKIEPRSYSLIFIMKMSNERRI